MTYDRRQEQVDREIERRMDMADFAKRHPEWARGIDPVLAQAFAPLIVQPKQPKEGSQP